MALTVTNTNTFLLLDILNRNSAAQSSSLQQLTTGKRINAGKDDPAGLIALSNLNSEVNSVSAALDNNQRTDAMLTVADKAIGEISGLLNNIQTLVQATASTANLTDAEISANQSQIDDALAAIDRIVNTTNFNGKKLLDGSLSVQHTGFAGNAYLRDLRIFSRSQATTDTTLTVSRVASAQVASASFAFAGGAARTSGTTTVSITGSLGTAVVTLTSGLTQAEIVTQINAATAQTGISAIQNSTNIKLNSTQYGQDAFVSVEVLSGGYINGSYSTATTDSSTGNDIRSQSKTTGDDANITINGQTTGTDGLDVAYNANGLSLEFTLADDFGRGATAATSTSFTVKAQGGATFQLGTSTSTRQTIGVDSLSSNYLGGGNNSKRLSDLKAGGSASLRNNVADAITAVKEAIGEVSGIRGRLGGFQKFQVGSAINQLQAAKVGLTDAASVIGDTDFALATANLSRQNVLIQSGVQLLGVANQQAGLILSLLS